MIDEAGKEAMEKRFREFGELWSGILYKEKVVHPEILLQCYYLDVIAGQLMELNKPKQIVLPPMAGRN